MLLRIAVFCNLLKLVCRTSLVNRRLSMQPVYTVTKPRGWLGADDKFPDRAKYSEIWWTVADLAGRWEGCSPHRHTAFLPVKTTASHYVWQNGCHKQKRFFDPKCVKSVWWWGSAWARRGSLQRPLDLLAGFNSSRSATWKDREKRGQGRNKDHFSFDLPSVSWSKRVKKFEAKFHACNNLLCIITCR